MGVAWRGVGWRGILWRVERWRDVNRRRGLPFYRGLALFVLVAIKTIPIMPLSLFFFTPQYFSFTALGLWPSDP